MAELSAVNRSVIGSSPIGGVGDTAEPNKDPFRVR